MRKGSHRKNMNIKKQTVYFWRLHKCNKNGTVALQY